MTDHDLDTTLDPAVRHGVRAATDDLMPDVERLVRGGAARGRTLRRRRRIGTSLATVAAIGVIGAVASVGPGLLEDDAPTPVAVADRGAAPADGLESAGAPAPTQSSYDLAVSAGDAPARIAELIGEGDLGAVQKGGTFQFVDEPERKIVHFLWDGTLTTFDIERSAGDADPLDSCEKALDPSYRPPGADASARGECVQVDAGVLLHSGPDHADGVIAQGATFWTHDYVVTVLSYNAPDGKDVAPTLAAPAISLPDAERIVRSDVWFD